MSISTPTLAQFSSELSALVNEAAARTLAVTGPRRRPITATVIGPDLAIAIHHVVGADRVQVQTADERVLEATVAGRDETRDLALLRVPGLGVTPLATAAKAPEPGSLAVSVSRTWHGRVTASVGLVASVRAAYFGSRLAAASDLILADVSSTPGISGSPLVNGHGEVTGIVNAGLARGVPLALPIAIVEQAVAALATRGRIRRGFLGIGLQPVAVSERQHATCRAGLLVVSLEAGGPAEQAGLLIGDVVITAGGQDLTDTGELQRLLATSGAGTTLSLGVLRGRDVISVEVAIGERPH